MKRKTLNLLNAAVQIVALFLLMTSKLASYRVTEHYTESFQYVPASRGDIYFGDVFSGNQLIGTIMLVLIGISILMCLGSAFRKTETRDSALHAALPIVIFACVFHFTGMGPYCVDGEITFASILYVINILMFASIILGFAKRSKAVAPAEAVTSVQGNNGTPEISKASELRMYKELLDEGTITQEEFDEKKKQLLGL